VADIQFLTEFDPEYRSCVDVAPGLRRVVANNPSKFTAWGTGTYLLGRGQVAIIDPGPALDSHVEALLAAVEGETVTHLLITHTHADHSPAAAAIREATGAVTVGFGPHPAAADTGGEEHGDHEFVPDLAVVHGERLTAAGLEVECLHTPGHISNHLCFAVPELGVLFSGDHVMGWSTSVIPPPDGRVADYLRSLELLLDRDDEVFLPTHGPPIPEPRTYVRQLIEHRLARERQILELLPSAPRTPEELVEVLYVGVRPELHEPAARSVRAHLVKLVEEGRVAGPDADDRYAVAGSRAAAVRACGRPLPWPGQG
jgi:glyoxylase-like metal-dependent hydrolase (beta-lactamase superfamily II)